MSTQHVQSDDVTVINIADRLRERGVEAVARGAVHATPAGTADLSTGTIRLGREHDGPVEKLPDAAVRKPAWQRLAVATGRAARTTGLGAGATVRRAWHYQQGGEFTAQIRETELLIALATDPAKRRALNDEIAQLRTARALARRERHRNNGTITAAAGGSVALVALVVCAIVFGLVVPAAAAVGVTGGAYVAGRREQKRHDSIAAVAAAPQREAIEGEPVDTSPIGEDVASDDGQISDQRILAALRGIKLIGADDTITPIGLPRPVEGDAIEVGFRLPVNVTVDALKAKDKQFAGALGLPVECIDIAEGATSRDVILWIASRMPFSDESPTSPLVTAERWDIWKGVPFGRNRKQRRRNTPVLWSSMLFGGAQGFGKTSAMYIPAAAGVLDPTCRLLLADFKGGADWEEVEQVAHRAIIGADPDAVDEFVALVDELIDEMDDRFARIRAMPKSRRPEMKLTPQIAAEDDMPVLMFIIDEIQEVFGALLARSADRELGIPSGRQQFAQLVEKLARLIRRGRACGLIVIAAAQRPSATSVPTDFRDVILRRYSVHVVDDTSSDMILGDKMASKGITAAGLGRVGVGVLVEPDGGEKIQPDRITPQQFEQICAQGRQLRIEAGTLTGYAAGKQREIGGLLGLMLRVFAEAGAPPHLTTADVISGLARLAPGEWAEVAAGDRRQAGTRLGKALAVELDGTGRSLTSVERSWGRGYLLGDVRAAAGIAPK